MKTKQLYTTIAFLFATFISISFITGQCIIIDETLSGTITPCELGTNCLGEDEQLITINITISGNESFTILDPTGTLYDFTELTTCSVGLTYELIGNTHTFTNDLSTTENYEINIPLNFCNFNFENDFLLEYEATNIGCTLDITQPGFTIGNQLAPTWEAETSYENLQSSPPDLLDVYISYSPNLNQVSRITKFTQSSNLTLESLYLDYTSESEISTTVTIQLLDDEGFQIGIDILDFETNPNQNLLVGIPSFEENFSIVITEEIDIIACTNSLGGDQITDTQFSISTCDCFDNPSLNSFSQTKNITVEDAGTNIEHCFSIEPIVGEGACMTEFNAVFTYTNPVIPDVVNNPNSGHKQLGWIVIPIDLDGFGFNLTNIEGEIRFYNPIDQSDYCETDNIISSLDFPIGFVNVYDETIGYNCTAVPDGFDVKRRLALDFSVLNGLVDNEVLSDWFSSIEDGIGFLEGGRFSVVFTGLSMDPDVVDLTAIDIDGVVTNPEPFFTDLAPFSSCGGGYIMFQTERNTNTNESYYTVYHTMCQRIEDYIDDEILDLIDYVPMLPHKYLDDNFPIDPECNPENLNESINDFWHQINYTDWIDYPKTTYYVNGQSYDHEIEGPGESLTVDFNVKFTIPDSEWNPWLLDAGQGQTKIIGCDDPTLGAQLEIPSMLWDICSNLGVLNISVEVNDEVIQPLGSINTTFLSTIGLPSEITTSDFCDFRYIDLSLDLGIDLNDETLVYPIEVDEWISVTIQASNDTECPTSPEGCPDWAEDGYFEGNIGMSFYTKCGDCSNDISMNLGCGSVPVNYRCGDCGGPGDAINFNTVDISPDKEFKVLRNTFGYREDGYQSGELSSEGLTRSQLEEIGQKITSDDSDFADLGINLHRIYAGDEVQIESWGLYEYVPNTDSLGFALQIGNGGETYIPTVEIGGINVNTSATGSLEFYPLDCNPCTTPLTSIDMDNVGGAPVVNCDILYDPEFLDELPSESFIMFPFENAINTEFDDSETVLIAGEQYYIKFIGSFETENTNSQFTEIIDLPLKGSYVNLDPDAGYCWTVQPCDFFETYLYLYKTWMKAYGTSSIWKASQICTRSYNFKIRSWGPGVDHFPYEFRPAFSIDEISISSPNNDYIMHNNYLSSPYYTMKLVNSSAPLHRIDLSLDGPMADLSDCILPEFPDDDDPMILDFYDNSDLDDIYDSFKMFDHTTQLVEFSITGLAEVNVCPQHPDPSLPSLELDTYEETITLEAMSIEAQFRNLIIESFVHTFETLSNPIVDPTFSSFTQGRDLKTHPICLETTQNQSTTIVETDFTVDNIELDVTDFGGAYPTGIMTFWIQFDGENDIDDLEDDDDDDLLLTEIRLLRSSGDEEIVIGELDSNVDFLYWFHLPSDFFPEEVQNSSFIGPASDSPGYLMDWSSDYELEFDFTILECPDYGDGKTFMFDYTMGIGCGTVGDVNDPQFNLEKCQTCNTIDPALQDCDDGSSALCNADWDPIYEGFLAYFEASIGNEELIANINPNDSSYCHPYYEIELSIPDGNEAFITDAENIMITIEYPIDWEVPLVEVLEPSVPLIAGDIVSSDEITTQSFLAPDDFNISENETIIIFVSFPSSGTYTDFNILSSVSANNLCGDPMIVTTPNISFDYQNNYDDASFIFDDFCFGEIGIPTSTESGGTYSFDPPSTDGSSIDAVTGEIFDETLGAIYNVQYTTNGDCPDSLTQEVLVLDCNTSVHDFCKIIPDLDNNPDTDHKASGYAVLDLPMAGYAVAGGININSNNLSHYVAKFGEDDSFEYGNFFGDDTYPQMDIEKTYDIVEEGLYMYTIGEVFNNANNYDVVVAKIEKTSGNVIWKYRYDFGRNQHGYAGTIIREEINDNTSHKLIVVGKSDGIKPSNYSMFALKINTTSGSSDALKHYAFDFLDYVDDIAHDIVALRNNQVNPELVIVGKSNIYAAAIKINSNLALDPSYRFVLQNKNTCYHTVDADLLGNRIFAMGEIRLNQSTTKDILISNFDSNLNFSSSTIESCIISQSSSAPRAESINDLVLDQTSNYLYACGKSVDLANNSSDGILFSISPSFTDESLYKVQYTNVNDELIGISLIGDDNLISVGYVENDLNNTLDSDLFIIKSDLDLNNCCTMKVSTKKSTPKFKKHKIFNSEPAQPVKKYPIQNDLPYIDIHNLCETASKQANANIDHFEKFEAEMTIVPNPNDGKFVVSIDSPSEMKISKIRVLDISGSLLETIVLNSDELTNEVELSLKSYPMGIYVVELITDNKLKFIGRVSIMK